METMIIERDRGVGGRRIGEASREPERATEGTAVFIGKASFRMIPVSQAENVAENIAENVQEEVDVGVTASDVGAARASRDREGAQSQDAFQIAETPSDVAWFTAHEENVILTPPATTAAEASAFEPLTPSVIGVDRQAHGYRRSMPVWAVAVALIAGATITLSAQAVMRRPGRNSATLAKAGVEWARPAATAPRLPAAPTIPAAAAAATPPALATAPSSAPTVVPSTVVWAVNAPPSFDSHGSAAASADHVRQARVARTLPRVAADAHATKSTRWVDPFVAADATAPSDDAGTHTPDNRMMARKSAAARASTNQATRSTKSIRWVDPFAP